MWHMFASLHTVCVSLINLLYFWNIQITVNGLDLFVVSVFSAFFFQSSFLFLPIEIWPIVAWVLNSLIVNHFLPCLGGEFSSVGTWAEAELFAGQWADLGREIWQSGFRKCHLNGSSTVKIRWAEESLNGENEWVKDKKVCHWLSSNPGGLALIIREASWIC